MKYIVETTPYYDSWFNKLKDQSGKIRILARLDRVSDGNFGDTKKIENSEMSELRFFFGSGFRIYYVIQENTIVVLLSGGDKSSQTKDIKKAKEILKELNE